MSADVFDVLLVEDNPGDARLIEEMLGEAEDLLQRVDASQTNGGLPRVRHEQRLSDGRAVLAADDADVILLDLNLPDSRGLDTLEGVVDATDLTPIVVLTGLDDRELGVEAIQRGAQDYLVKDEVTSDLLARSIQYAVERSRQERERARRREELEALNRLNRIAQDITHVVITTETQEELEQAVCDRLVESDAYRFAWIGTVDRGTDRIEPRVSAGVEEGYLDEITITIDDADTAQGPGGRAVRTQEVQVMQNILTDPTYEPWREPATERGYRSSAAIPIVHEDLIYGLLGVYAASPNAFSEREVEILSRLGDVIGHAIAAIERKDALVADTVLELEFRVDGLVDELVRLAGEQQGTIEFENLIRGEDLIVAYGHAAGVPQDGFQEVAERAAAIDDLRVLAGDGDEFRFEIATATVTPVVEAVSSHGGRIESARIDDGEFRFVVEFPPGRDKRKLVELVDEHCDDATNVAQRTVQRSEPEVANARSVLQEDLTDKQRTALETAYWSGFFDWPRTSNGEEIAERLGITASTFTQHLRAAERRFFDSVFDDEQ